MFERGSEFREGAFSPISIGLPSPATEPQVWFNNQAGEGTGVRHKMKTKYK
jgi:hypothetical protein